MSASPRAALLPLPMLLLFVGLATAPLWLKPVGLYQYLALEIMIWMLFALGYNLLLGYGGLPSFGHGAFFGIGAYAFGLLQLKLWANLWFDLVGAPCIAAGFGALVATFISHRRGIYYALLTIAFGQVFWFVAIKWHSVTGGEDGLLNIKRLPADFGFISFDLTANQSLYYFAFVVFALVVVLLWRLVHSPFGRILTAIKQNEIRAAFVGYDVWLYKWIAFTLSAAVAGLAGALFAMAQQSAYPNVMSLHSSGFVVMMVLIGGGLVSFWGPVLGALFFILARDLLGAYTETWLLWYGLLFMVMVLWQPEGIAGIWQAWRRRTPRRPHSPRARWPEAMALFEAVHLHKRFGDAVVLEDISLSFDEGRLSGIMGPNGAGKTTCFNVLTGRYKPDRGEVRFDGRMITGASPRAVARLGISRSFQVMNLFNDYTALDNVLVALPAVRGRGFNAWPDLGRRFRRAGRGRCRAGARRPGGARAHSREEPPLRRTACARDRRGACPAPRLLFLDEPTAGLGTEGTARLFALIAELKRTLTIVVIEHDMQFLFGLADRISVIHWGQVIAAGTPDELRADPWVRRSNSARWSNDAVGRPHRHVLRRDAGAPRRVADREPAKSSRCSVRTAPARPRCCAPSWASHPPARARSGSTAAT